MASCNTKYGMEWQPALLKKEHFVCDIEKPKEEDYHNFSKGGVVAFNKANEAYQAAQDQLIFEGFEKDDGRYDLLIHESMTIQFTNKDIVWFDDKHIKAPTVYDLFYFVDRYNRTASEKIKINYTQQFIKKIIG